MDPQIEEQAVGRRSAYLLFALGTAVVIAFLFRLWFLNFMNDDGVSYLVEAKRALGGSEIYGPHLVESNVPLIIWFSEIPVLLGQWFGWYDGGVLRWLTVAMVVASAVWSVRIVQVGEVFRRRLSGMLFGVGFVLLELHVVPGDLGEREQLVMICMLPFLLAHLTDSMDRFGSLERIAMGISAGAAIWFKPHFVVLPLVLAAVLVLRRRSLRAILGAEFWAMTGTSLFILILTRLLTPLYFSTTVPLLMDTYWALGDKTTWALALTMKSFYWQTVAVLLLSLLLRKYLSRPMFVPVALLLSCVAAFMFDIQHTDWSYHRFPCELLFALSVFYLVLDLADGLISRSGTPYRIERVALAGYSLLLCVMLAMAVAGRPRLHLRDASYHLDAMDRYVQTYPPGTTMTFFTTSVGPINYVHRAKMNWGSRFAHQWMLSAIIKNERNLQLPGVPFKRLAPARVAQLAQLQRSQTAEDLHFWKPTVFAVQVCTAERWCQGIPGIDFDIVAWLSQDPAFAEEMKHYKLVGTIEIFRVYQRVD
jgi:hypothetical protein